MMTPPTHYQHSGKAPLFGTLLTLIAGSAAAVILGAIYALLIYWIPFIYINAFLTFGLGIALATLVGTLGKIGKIRNNTVITVIALFVSIVAYYAHWVVWVENMTESYALEPTVLWQFIATIAELGPWSIFDWTPAGWAMWSIWGVEALMIVGLGSISAYGVIDVPFCEATKQWATETTLATRFKTLDSSQNPDSPVSLLRALQPLAESSPFYTQVTVAEVDGSELRCVSVQDVEVEIRDDKEELKTTDRIKNMLFDRSSFESLINSSSMQLTPDADGLSAR